MKKIMSGLLFGIVAAFLLVPGVAGAQTNCAEFCAQDGVEDVETCMKTCEDYLLLTEGSNGGVGCLLKAMEECDLSAHNVIEILKLNIVCLEHGFEDPRCNNMCGLTESCISALCCNSSQGKKTCLYNWKFNCKKQGSAE